MGVRRAIGCALVLSSLSCAGGTTNGPPPPSALAVASAAPPAPASAPPPPPELAPDGLILIGHVAHPQRLLPIIAPFAGPVRQTLASLDSQSLAKMVLGAPVGPILDLTQSVDFAVTMPTDGAPDGAVSGALVDTEEARRALEQFFALEPVERGGDGDAGRGVFRVRARKDGAVEPTQPCWVAAALPRGQRLVCGGSEAAVRALVPYVARTLPASPSRADVHAELQMPTLAARFRDSPYLKPDGTLAGAFGMDTVSGLIGDFGAVALDVLQDEAMVDVTLSLPFADTAPITRALFNQARRPTRPGASPPAFARLPRGAGLAFYADGADQADEAALRSMFDGYIRLIAQLEGHSASNSEATTAALDKLFWTGGPWVIASGHALEASSRALDAYVAADKTTAGARLARASIQGWMVAAVDEPPGRWIDGVREIVRLDQLPPKDKQAFQQSEARLREKSRTVITPVPSGLKLPAGTLHVEHRVTPGPASVAASKGDPEASVIAHTTHVFIVPDDARTWIAIAEAPAVAAEHVRASLSGAPPSGTLQSRPGFDALVNANAGAGLWLSFDELAMLLFDDASDADLRKARDAVHALLSIGDMGTVLVPVTLDTTPTDAADANGHGSTCTVHTRLPLRGLAEWAAAAQAF